MILVTSVRPGQPRNIVIILQIRISYPDILILLIGRIHHLESIPPNKLIIPINQHLYIIFMAVTECRIDYVISSIVSLQILYVLYAILWEFDIFHVFDCFFHGVIS